MRKDNNYIENILTSVLSSLNNNDDKAAKNEITNLLNKLRGE